jgi:hypothetical protein
MDFLIILMNLIISAAKINNFQAASFFFSFCCARNFSISIQHQLQQKLYLNMYVIFLFLQK